MADDKEIEKNAEQTRITLDQLSQTLEVMSCVVDRLKQHLNRQMSLNAELFQDGEAVHRMEEQERAAQGEKLREKSFVVEISQQELEDDADTKIVH